MIGEGMRAALLSEWLVLVATPWDWMLERFGFAPRYRGAIMLLAGGIFLATVIITTVLVIHVVMPGNGNPYALSHRPRAVTRTARDPRFLGVTEAPVLPAGSFREGHVAGVSAAPATLDDVLDAAVASGLGEPRILHTTGKSKHVRFYVCGACGHAGGPAGCEYVAGFLAGGFEALLGVPVTVRELACSARAGTYCEFEVAYAEASAPSGALAAALQGGGRTV